jgi:galactokinase
VPRERAGAFAPGRVNLIGEHTDYNLGLALPFAVSEGVTVRAQAADPASPDAQRIYAHARDLGQSDEFALSEVSPALGWRAFVRGTVAELSRAGYPLVGARLQITGGLQRGAGLSSSAALEVALCLALIALGSSARAAEPQALERVALARLCARVENDWVGAQTGLLDQLASLCGAAETALLIDFRSLQIDPVPLRLGDWRFVVLDSGERHANASSGYNERRAECLRACRLLGIDSLRQASPEELEQLPEPLRARAEHVLGENARVREAVAALRSDELSALGTLLNASHESLRDRYEVSTPRVESTRERLIRAGASGARLIGGGFGGSLLALFAPGVPPPPQARVVRPGPGAHLLAD